MKKNISKKRIIVTLVVLIVAFGGYTAFFKHSEVKQETIAVKSGDFLQQVSVSGKVVSAKDVSLGFSQSGKVSQVRGSVGDTVTEGTILVEIEDGDLRALFLQKQAFLESQQAKLQSLQEGARPESIAVAQASVDSAELSLERANQGVVNAVSEAYSKADDAIRNKADQFFTNSRTIPQLVFATTDSQAEINIVSDRSLLEKMLNEWASNSTSDTAIQTQAYLNQVTEFLTDASALLNKVIVTETTTQTKVDQYKNDIAVARTSIDASKNALNSALTVQKTAVSGLNTAQKNLALVQAGSSVSDIDAQKAQVKAAQADLENVQAQLQKTRIVAPFSGVVTKMDAKTGQIVSPNTPLVSLIGKGVFQIESYIPEINIAMVKVGDTASVTLDAYGAEVLFEARIVLVDPAETIQNGVSTYRAVLEFVAQDPRIKSGMTANVVITTQKRDGVIAVPQGLVIDRDGKKFLLVQNGDTTKDVEVTTGDISSFGEIEILTGIKEGDVVVVTSGK